MTVLAGMDLLVRITSDMGVTIGKCAPAGQQSVSESLAGSAGPQVVLAVQS